MQRFGGLGSAAADLKLEVLFLPALSDQEFNPARHRAATTQTLLRQTNMWTKKKTRFFMLLQERWRRLREFTSVGWREMRGWGRNYTGDRERKLLINQIIILCFFFAVDLRSLKRRLKIYSNTWISSDMGTAPVS